MGLAGGPHCAAMCGTACAGLMRAGVNPSRSLWLFQAGRLAGYSLAGAAAAAAVQSFAWLATNSAAIKPLWTLFHLAVLAWGLMLVTRAHQPVWVSNTGRSVWSRVRPLAASGKGVFAAGALWAFMPCGLLYSALLVASLSGGPAEGALTMALFALGSAVSLSLAPMLLLRLQGAGNRFRQEWGTRVAGLLLAAAAVWALWMDMAHQVAVWCGLA
ncbi:sulfite exporter TauE/SafE family protein [Caenimonas koreensis]|uniref:Sulfite exporter TauE/SafE family protein n=1 Tax=Caenimonas koreensis DSM 17982 TaxID=1121255 RepID=A0A844AV51_9BURK|nr:sulfite exporter TauE/SafE family protein [Caenimonas koreensis]MRD47974.1 sulfite exporter TauE/SafE family protein [Caenimonas koreensis DSM 17982]